MIWVASSRQRNFDPIATKLVSKYVPRAKQRNLWIHIQPDPGTTTNQYIGRLDYSINPSNQITALGVYHKSTATDTLPFTGATVPGLATPSILTIQQYTGDYVHQFNSTTVNDLAGHYTRFNYAAVSRRRPFRRLASDSTSTRRMPRQQAFPQFGGVEAPSASPWDSAPTGLSHVSTRWRRSTTTSRRSSVAIRSSSAMTAAASMSPIPSSPTTAVRIGFNNTGIYTTGDGGLDFLLGVPASYAQGSGASIIAEAFLNYVFAQDNWKLTDKFTLSYGLGYSIDTPLHNLQYGGSGIVCVIPGEQSTVFAGAPTSLVYGGDKGCTNGGLAKTRYSEFGPRVGFIYAPDWGAISGAPGKFSIRGGFGIYYDRTEEETALQTLETPPFGTSTIGAGTH